MAENIGGSSFDEGYAIDALPDGTVVAAGSTCSPQIPVIIHRITGMVRAPITLF